MNSFKISTDAIKKTGGDTIVCDTVYHYDLSNPSIHFVMGLASLNCEQSPALYNIKGAKITYYDSDEGEVPLN